MSLHAQVNDDMQQQLELLTGQDRPEDADYSSITERMEYYQEHPLNLNRASREELLELPFMTETCADQLLQHIERNGKLLSVYELQGINGFTLSQLYKLLPYVKVNEETAALKALRFSDIWQEGRHEIISRYQRILEPQSGFAKRSSAAVTLRPDKYYIGTPDKLYQRYRFSYSNKISLGILAEKDAGESLRRIDTIGKRAGFDFYSGHIAVKNMAFIKAFVLGDYQATFGQGLVLWKGYGFGKSAQITGVKRIAPGIRGYNSVDENNFFRGTATALQIKKWQLTIFCSDKKKDARVSVYDSISGDVKAISALIETGLHTTLSEWKNRNRIHERVIGNNITWHGKHLHVGSTTVYYKLSSPLSKQEDLYKFYSFSGSENHNTGVDFSYVHRNMNFYGEVAFSRNGGKALCSGIIFSLSPSINFVMHYRNFDRHYQNLLAAAVSENTTVQNERGLYVALESTLAKNISCITYLDFFRFPWLKYRVSAPSLGYEFLSQLTRTYGKKANFYLRFRRNSREENTSQPDRFIYPVLVMQDNYRFHASLHLLPFLKLAARLEYVIYAKQSQAIDRGIFLFEELLYKKTGSRLSASLRYALFESNTYNSRIYTYENDLPGAYSIPAFYGKGSKCYLILKYDISHHLDAWIRLSRTFYAHTQIQNEGELNEIQGPVKTEIKIQMSWRIGKRQE